MVQTFTILPLPTASATMTVVDTLGYQFPTLPEPIMTAALSIAASRVIGGHPVWVFDIPQVVNLTFPSALQYQGIYMNNYPVQRTDFRLVRGVNNQIVFFVRDIDRKPVQLNTGDVLTINIVDPSVPKLLMQRALTVMDLTKGIYQLNTLPAEQDTWPTGPLRYSIIYTPNGSSATTLLWTDQSYSPYSHCYITETPIPGPAPTVVATWDDFSRLTDDRYYIGPLIGAAQDGYLDGMQTFIPTLDDFTGNIRIDATLTSQPDMSAESPDWFEIDSEDYSAFTGTDEYDLVGNYLWLRVAVHVTTGSVTQVAYKV